MSAVACTRDLEITSVALVHDPVVVVVVAQSGSLYRCDLSQDVLAPLDCSVSGGVHRAVATRDHTALSDEAGRLWTWGRPPQVGTVTECQTATRLRFSPGTEIVQLVAGRDFTAALVRRRKSGVQLVPDTPDTPDGDLDRHFPDVPVCPLGLALQGQPSPSLNVDIDQTDSSCDITSDDKTLSLPGPVTNVMSQVTSQVTSLGRSVWTNSMSLLSISSQQESEAGPGWDSSSVSASSPRSPRSSRSPSLKSRSEPPGCLEKRLGGAG